MIRIATPAALLALLTAFGPLAAAQRPDKAPQKTPEAVQDDGPKRRGARQPGKRTHRAEILARFDANKNGKLEPAEREKAREALAAGRKRAAKRQHAAMLKQFDANKDGKLDRAEVKQARGVLCKAKGKKGSGERGGERTRKPKSEKRLQKPAQERRKRNPKASGRRQAILEKYDTNKNGKLDKDEAAKARAELRGSGKRGG
ncbi:MAG: hypothetical protein GY711_15940 [bacterium]|nr:hypothetical protein [bacterium]